jgi:hypothetical protein
MAGLPLSDRVSKRGEPGHSAEGDSAEAAVRADTAQPKAHPPDGTKPAEPAEGGSAAAAAGGDAAAAAATAARDPGPAVTAAGDAAATAATAATAAATAGGPAAAAADRPAEAGNQGAGSKAAPAEGKKAESGEGKEAEPAPVVVTVRGVAWTKKDAQNAAALAMCEALHARGFLHPNWREDCVQKMPARPPAPPRPPHRTSAL